MLLTPWRLRLLIISLLTVSFLGALDHTVVATSLATISGDLGAVQQMSWVIVSYTLASTVLLPVLGKLADLVGARLIFLASLILFLIASLLCGFAQDITQLALARVAQGIGSAGVIGEIRLLHGCDLRCFSANRSRTSRQQVNARAVLSP